MKNTFKHLMIAVLFGAVLPAQAAVVNYTFDGEIDSGFYTGETFLGSFSFDDASLTNIGSELISLNAANLNFLGTSFNQANFTAGTTPSVVFQNGVFSGLEWSFDSTTPNVGFSFIAGSVDASDAFISYETTSGVDGSGVVNYSAVAAVPEAQTYAMFLAGLGLMGIVARRKRA